MKTYVYFIQQGYSYIKIGVADDPEARMRTLQTGCAKTLRIIAQFPCDSRLAAFNLEAELHRKFIHLRISGEWYKRAIIREMKVGGKRVICGTYKNPLVRPSNNPEPGWANGR